MAPNVEPGPGCFPIPPSKSAGTPAVELRGICRRFGAVAALDSITLTVADGEFFSLLGPSGCGKTTLLRILAGLDTPDAGDLRLGGAPAIDLPAHRRPVNTVFQSYALFPHMTVAENVGFGLRMKKVAPAILRDEVRAAMELTRITALADRRPARLSGGEKQRVALARALVNRPRVLLLDEPLAALDLQLRRELRSELHALQRRTGIAFILVTHDQEEALALSDRMAVLRAGRIEQCGTGEELYSRPGTAFVAAFLGACNLIHGRVSEVTPDSVRIATRFGTVTLPSPAQGLTQTLNAGAEVTLGIRPEHVVPITSGAEASRPNTFSGRVTLRTYTGAEVELTLDLHGEQLRLRLGTTDDSLALLKPTEGSTLTIHLPGERLLAWSDALRSGTNGAGPNKP